MTLTKLTEKLKLEIELLLNKISHVLALPSGSNENISLVKLGGVLELYPYMRVGKKGSPLYAKLNEGFHAKVLLNNRHLIFDGHAERIDPHEMVLLL